MRGTVLILLSSVVLYCSGCTEVEHRKMQELFSSCRANYTNKFHARGLDGKVCNLLDSILEECSKEWEKCHNSQEIAKMKEMHTDAFIRHWADHPNIEMCTAVKKFRASLRTEVSSEDEPAGCEDEESSQAMSAFQTCSHSFSTAVYSRILDVEAPDLITNILCQGLHNISRECPVHLQTCFAPDDVKEMKKLHLQEMKRFFKRLGVDRMPKDALDKCDEFIQKVPILDSLSSTEHHNPIDLQVYTDAPVETPSPPQPSQQPSTPHQEPPQDPSEQPQQPQTPEEDSLEEFPSVTASLESEDGFDAIQRILRTDSSRDSIAEEEGGGEGSERLKAEGMVTDRNSASQLMTSSVLLVLSFRHLI